LSPKKEIIVVDHGGAINSTSSVPEAAYSIYGSGDDAAPNLVVVYGNPCKPSTTAGSQINWMSLSPANEPVPGATLQSDGVNSFWVSKIAGDGSGLTNIPASAIVGASTGNLSLPLASGTIALKRYGLDFNAGSCLDLTCKANSTTFFTTNAAGDSAHLQRRMFIIRAGTNSPALFWPANWSVLGPMGISQTGTLPTKLLAGQLLRLTLESVGPGESNILASAQIALDHSGR
jgi:hypothetical protein